MHWLQLLGAILFEVAGTTSMKLSDGFTRLVPSVLLFACYAVSFILLTFAIRRIEVSVAYPVWSGLGTLAIGVIGWVLFKEQMTWIKVISILAIVGGVVGLTMSGDAPH